MENKVDNVIIDNECSAAFTGHRFLPYDKRADIKAELENLIKEWYKEGITHYYCGMAWGFDLLAAECVLSVKKEFPQIALIAVIPFRKQCEMWNENSRKHYHAILRKADIQIILSEKYYKGCLLVRNDFMLEHANKLVAYYDGQQRGGTFYTYYKARQKDMPITNLYKIL